jgi:hypothetical protein
MHKRIGAFILLAVLSIGLLAGSAFGTVTYTPLQSVEMIALEDLEANRSTLTLYASIAEGAALPASIRFSLPSTFKVKMMKALDPETGERGEDLDFTTQASENEIGTEYSVSLISQRVFIAGFEIEGTLYDRSTQMGDSPIASMMFIPPNNLDILTMAFVAPSYDYVGAGADVQFLGEADGGEMYGIVRENVKEGEVESFAVAFAPRADRDAALAAMDEAEAAAAEAARQATWWYWFTTPAGMVVIGAALVLLIAVVALVVLLKRKK